MNFLCTRRKSPFGLGIYPYAFSFIVVTVWMEGRFCLNDVELSNGHGLGEIDWVRLIVTSRQLLLIRVFRVPYSLDHSIALLP